MSSFSTAISGLNAAANDIAVISNNIANANTTGFKESVAQFADSYANHFQSINSATGVTTQPGTGVSVVQDIQQFNQGTAQVTGNNLNMAINGNGFFTLAPNPTNPSAVVYSRAGSFQVNNAGMVINPQGEALLAYQPNNPASAAAGFNTGAMSTITIPSGAGLPVATTTINQSVNLNVASKPPATSPFNPLDSTSYSSSTSTTVYDSVGVSHNLTTYYVAQGADPKIPNQTDWATYNYMTDNPAAPVAVTVNASSNNVNLGGIPSNNPTFFSAPLLNDATLAVTTATTAAAAAAAAANPAIAAVNAVNTASTSAAASATATVYSPTLQKAAVNQAITAQIATTSAATVANTAYNNSVVAIGTVTTPTAALTNSIASAAAAAASADPTVSAAGTAAGTALSNLATEALAVKTTAATAATSAAAYNTAAQAVTDTASATAAALLAGPAQNPPVAGASAADDAALAEAAVATYNADLALAAPYLPIQMATNLTMGYTAANATNAAAALSQATSAQTSATAAAKAATQVFGSTNSTDASAAATAATAVATAATAAGNTTAATAATAAATAAGNLVTDAAAVQSTATASATAATAYALAAAQVVDSASGDQAAKLATAAATAAQAAQTAASNYQNDFNLAAPYFAYTAGTMQTFGSSGQLTSPATSSLSWTLSGSTPTTASINYAGTTQTASTFNVNSSSQNGTIGGTVTSVSVDGTGIVSANYSNGTSTALGQVALANFTNPQGLVAIGGTDWVETSASGAPKHGAAGGGSFGSIQSGAVEQSNVNLSDQLVSLITAQQAYSANSQSITASSKMIETILNAVR